MASSPSTARCALESRRAPRRIGTEAGQRKTNEGDVLLRCRYEYRQLRLVHSMIVFDDSSIRNVVVGIYRVRND